MNSKKIEIGDIVIVSHPGYSYTTYKDMAKILMASENWAYNRPPMKGIKCEVLNTHMSPIHDRNHFVLIRCLKTLDEYIIGDIGLTLHSKGKENIFLSLKDEDLFI